MKLSFEWDKVWQFKNTVYLTGKTIAGHLDAAPLGLVMMAEILAEDLRCIDAHAHLGNWEFNVSNSYFDLGERRAARHYEALEVEGDVCIMQKITTHSNLQAILSRKQSLLPAGL